MDLKYKHIFFDLDHTLWDFERCSQEALIELYDRYKMEDYGLFDCSAFISSFETMNNKLWDLYNTGKIEREQLRKDRFVWVLGDLGLAEDRIPSDLGEAYVDLCPQKPYLIPHAKDVLDYLKEKRYQLHIITNGFEDVQYRKMTNSGILDYFEHIITSEKAGQKKPYRQIFDYALTSANALRTESIMIGDNLQTDIGGAKLAEMDHVFFNPNKESHRDKVQHEINSLIELKSIL